MDFRDVISEEIKGYDVNKNIVKLKTGKRYSIKLNEIVASANRYRRTSLMKSKQLISTPVKSISIFSNEYIPSHFPKGQHILYILTVNGKDYKVQPVNSSRDGDKVIRVANNLHSSSYTHYIEEDIKSAVLTIQINSYKDNQTPYVSNIKILTGGE